MPPLSALSGALAALYWGVREILTPLDPLTSSDSSHRYLG